MRRDPCIEFFVEGTPAPKGSKTAGRGGFGMREASKFLPAWDKALDAALATIPDTPEAQQVRDGKEIVVRHVFYLARPKKHYRANGELRADAPTFHSVKPDYDKLERAVNDAISRAGLWQDDARVVDGGAVKLYGGGPGETPTGVRTRIWSIS